MPAYKLIGESENMITEDKCWPEPALPPCVLWEQLPSMHHTVTLAKARGLGQLTKGHAPVPQACLLSETRCPAAVAVASSPAYVQEGPAYSCLLQTEQMECACPCCLWP